MAMEAPLLHNGEALPEGWERCFRRIIDRSTGESRFVPSLPIHFVMMALCFINTFAGTFLVPHSENLAKAFGKGPIYAAMCVCTPYITNIFGIYLSKWSVPKNGWLVATLTNCFFMVAGTALSFCCLTFESMRNPHLFLLGGLVYGFGMGFQFIGRQLGVVTSSNSARNKIFAQQTIATSFGILGGTSTSGLTTLFEKPGTNSPDVLAIPFAVLGGLAIVLAGFMVLTLPNRVVQVPEEEAPTSPVAAKGSSAASQMPDTEKKLRIWSTLVIGFNRVVVRSMVENETTAFYQSENGYPEYVSSSCLALAYFTGIVVLYLFGYVHDRLVDRVWIYVTLSSILVGTVLQVQWFTSESYAFVETVKFTVGLCFVLPGLAVNTAVANSTATKYSINSHWLYKQDMIGLLQIVTQTALARILGPFFGYVLARQSFTITLIVQAVITLLSLVLTYVGVSANAAETAKGRADLRKIESK
eukprot:TRINITY_DN25338_c0_g1_i1.p1 TRINITY_DN25338_c0_g1~~TRINITY_DN25338_c0_g1_i1.p1  ORF type:complete len:472 (-),score=104.39 TRINITY_DN25338_c0_g1_i1:451-1866(-)